MAGKHGSTPAAWTTVALVLLGFAVGAIGMVIGPNWLVFSIGVAIVLIAAVVGRVLSAMGLGESHPPRI